MVQLPVFEKERHSKLCKKSVQSQNQDKTHTAEIMPKRRNQNLVQTTRLPRTTAENNPLRIGT